MLISNPLTGNSLVVALLLLAEWMSLALFLWELRVGMEMLKALVTSIGLCFDVRMQLHFRLFEHTEVVFFSRTEIGADDLKESSLGILWLGLLGYNELGFERMAFLFARVRAFLSFFGRSMGDSVASIRITS